MRTALFKIDKTNIVGILLVVFYMAVLPCSTVMFDNWGNGFLNVCYIIGAAAIACIALTALKTIVSEYKKEENKKFYFQKHWLEAVWMIIGLIVCVTARSTKILQMFFILEALKECDSKKITKYLYFIHALFIIFVIFCSTQGWLNDLITGREGEVRHSLGFMYPLEAHGELFLLTLLHVYLRQDRFDLADLLLLNLVNVVLYNLTKARTDFVLIIFVTICAYLVHVIGKDKVAKVAEGWILDIYTIIVLWLPVFFTIFSNPESGFFQKLDSLLSQRLTMQKQGMAQFGLTLFGQKIEWVGWGITADQLGGRTYNFIDNSFLHDMFNFGIVFLILITIMWILAFRSMKKRNDVYGILICVIFLFGSSFEYHTFTAYFAPAMYLMAYAFQEKTMKNIRLETESMVS